MSETIEEIAPNGAPPLSEQASSQIQRPAYWRDAAQILTGNAGEEFELAMLEVQKTLDPVMLANKHNSFTDSDYANLAAVLAYVRPILNDNGFLLRQMAGDVRIYGGQNKGWPMLPIVTHLSHVESRQWELSILPIVFEPKMTSVGGAFTFGKRYGLLSYLGIATEDDDGMAVLQSRIDQEATEAAAAGIIATIEECATLESLDGWLTKNDEGLKLISEGSLKLVRQAYGARKKELAEPPKAKQAAE